MTKEQVQEAFQEVIDQIKSQSDEQDPTAQGQIEKLRRIIQLSNTLNDQECEKLAYQYGLIE